MWKKVNFVLKYKIVKKFCIKKTQLYSKNNIKITWKKVEGNFLKFTFFDLLKF